MYYCDFSFKIDGLALYGTTLPHLNMDYVTKLELLWSNKNHIIFWSGVFGNSSSPTSYFEVLAVSARHLNEADNNFQLRGLKDHVLRGAPTLSLPIAELVYEGFFSLKRIAIWALSKNKMMIKLSALYWLISFPI